MCIRVADRRPDTLLGPPAPLRVTRTRTCARASPARPCPSSTATARPAVELWHGTRIAAARAHPAVGTWQSRPAGRRDTDAFVGNRQVCARSSQLMLRGVFKPSIAQIERSDADAPDEKQQRPRSRRECRIDRRLSEKNLTCDPGTGESVRREGRSLSSTARSAVRRNRARCTPDVGGRTTKRDRPAIFRQPRRGAGPARGWSVASCFALAPRMRTCAGVQLTVSALVAAGGWPTCVWPKASIARAKTRYEPGRNRAGSLSDHRLAPRANTNDLGRSQARSVMKVPMAVIWLQRPPAWRMIASSTNATPLSPDAVPCSRIRVVWE